MGHSVLSDTHCVQLCSFIAETMGLSFPRERWPDLRRDLAGISEEFGFSDVSACVDWLLSASLSKEQFEVLASHLTIGETYFFREKKTFDFLATNVLPELIRSRRDREPRLRIWSAGCCTGEEAYSLAIVLQQILPDLPDWHVKILATDINARFLRKAAAGTYGEWSFRDTPVGFKERYFYREPNGHYTVLPQIKEMVSFAQLNLVEDVYPTLATDTNAMDLIFCRNVLMYFTPAQTRKAIGNFRHALIEGGWLAVSPSEASQDLFPQFITHNPPGVILFQKERSDEILLGGQGGTPPTTLEVVDHFPVESEMPLSWTLALISDSVDGQPIVPPMGTSAPVETDLTTFAMIEVLYGLGRYAEVEQALRTMCTARAPDSQIYSLMARALANQGKLTDALAWCDRWVAADKIDPVVRYLRAMILLEIGDNEEARHMLQTALYLNPNFVLAHFALGNLAHAHNKKDEADKHFANALHLLNRFQPPDVLPGADGLTAGRLTEIITSVKALTNAA